MRWIVSTRFNNLDKIARVSAPKLFIHGRADERVPFDMAEQLFAAAPAPKRQLWLARARHDETFYVERARATQAMAEFVSDVARR
jgi:fermentation-respiration switch protein FrsA (DUF1100 family)